MRIPVYTYVWWSSMPLRLSALPIATIMVVSSLQKCSRSRCTVTPCSHVRMSSSQMWLVLSAISCFLLPAVSSSSCLPELPCNTTIEIRPPFFVGTAGLDPACWKSVNVSCGDFGPELNLITGSKLRLKHIFYANRTVVVQDVQLSVLELEALPCNLRFSFTPPVSSFQSRYLDLQRWFSSISCSESNLSLFHQLFGDSTGVSVYQNSQPDEHTPASCHAFPLFEWILQFAEIGGGATQISQVNFSVLSARITKDPVSSTDCASPYKQGNIPN